MHNIAKSPTVYGVTGQTSSSGAGKDKPAPAVNLNAKRPFAGLEKSLKDLHRQTLALTRIKMMLSDEMDRCYKKITEVFEDFHTAYVFLVFVILDAKLARFVPTLFGLDASVTL